MIQFTLGCILLALTIFFGGKEILANNNIVENRSRTVQSQEDKVYRANKVKEKYTLIQEDTIAFSTEIKSNIVNQLNIDENKYKFELKEPSSKDKVLSVYDFDIIGFDKFSKIFNLISDVEKIKGLELVDICFNCDVKDDTLIQRESEIGFKVKGKAYVYTTEKN